MQGFSPQLQILTVFHLFLFFFPFLSQSILAKATLPVDDVWESVLMLSPPSLPFGKKVPGAQALQFNCIIV